MTATPDKPETGGPAFPQYSKSIEDKGMTLRQWYAGLAMAELIQYRESSSGSTYTRPELAEEAFHYANEMVKVDAAIARAQ